MDHDEMYQLIKFRNGIESEKSCYGHRMQFINKIHYSITACLYNYICELI